MGSLIAGVIGALVGAGLAWVLAARRTRGALETKMRREQALLSGAAQQLRRPLSEVLGLTQSLSMHKSELPEDAAALTEKISGAGASAKAVLLDVYDILDIQAGQLQIKKNVDLLPDAIEAVKRMNKQRAETCGVRLEFEIHASAYGWFLYDDLRFRQCVGAMTRQAVLQNGGGAVKVEVSAAPHPKRRKMRLIEVTVSGDGESVEPDITDSYFSARHYADNPLLMKSGGSPLSLIVARMLARLMGGDLSAESTEGEGVTFRFSAPSKFVRKATEESSASDITAFDSATRLLTEKTVLIVDDDRVSLEVLETFLRRLQPGKILLAQNGKDALDILERTKCDLVLTDIQMPVMDGLVMLRRMRAADRPWRKLPAVAVSAAATGNDRRAALSAGANAFLAKPVSPDALYEAVTRRMRD